MSGHRVCRRQLMGWRLAEEIAWARPKRPGDEWWTLMDIGQDARDETRQSMCGHEYLMARGKCSKATLYRRLEALRENKLITVVRRSAPGVRAIYEVAELHGTGLTVAETRTPVDNPPAGPVDNEETGLSVTETRCHVNGSQSEPERVSKSAERVSAFVRHTPSVPRHTYPVTTDGSVSPPTGGSARDPSGQDLDLSQPSKLEIAAWQATQSRKERISGSA